MTDPDGLAHLCRRIRKAADTIATPTPTLDLDPGDAFAYHMLTLTLAVGVARPALARLDLPEDPHIVAAVRAVLDQVADAATRDIVAIALDFDGTDPAVTG